MKFNFRLFIVDLSLIVYHYMLKNQKIQFSELPSVVEETLLDHNVPR